MSLFGYGFGFISSVGGGVIASPSEIFGSNLLGWWDSDAITSLPGVSGDGDPVPSWTNKGTSGTVTALTGGPATYRINITNGKPGVDFFADYLTATAAILTDYPFTYLCVTKPTLINDNGIVSIGSTTASSFGKSSSLLLSNSTGGVGRKGTLITTDDLSPVEWLPTANTWTTNVTYYQEAISTSPTLRSSRLDNGSAAIGTTNIPVVTMSWDRTAIGGAFSTGGGLQFPFVGYIHEVMIINAVPTAQQLTDVRKYINNKWAVTVP
jgi:hypothetical protein